jgi:hypothetical protein
LSYKIIPWRSLGLLVLISVSIIFGLYFFYGAGSNVSGVEVLKLNPLNNSVALVSGTRDGLAPLFTTLQARGLNESLSSLLYIVFVLLGRQTFLLSGLIAYFLFYPYQQQISITLLFLGIYCAGVGVICLLESSFQEQWAFLWYGDIGMAILGATGLIYLILMKEHRSIKYCLISFSILVLLIQSYDLIPGVLKDLRNIGIKTVYPSYSTHPDYNALVDWLRQNVTAGSVIFTAGNYQEVDDRTLPAAVPGIQLYASRHILDIYAERSSIDPKIIYRQNLLSHQPLSLETILSVRQEVLSSRSLYLIWVGPGQPPSSKQIVYKFRHGIFSVWLIKDA